LEAPSVEKKNKSPAPPSKFDEDLPPLNHDKATTSPEPTMPAEPAVPGETIPTKPTKETPSTQSKKTETVLPEPNGEKRPELQPKALDDVCPSPKDTKAIKELTTNILPSEGDLPRDCPLGNAIFQQRHFSPITYTWSASGLCHKPLYFEDEQLERYGHMAGPWLQPWISGAHFFATIPILPYKMGLEPPDECMYALGYYRPGDCAPYLFDPLPLSLRGTLFEASGWVAGVAMFP
jgi:hypothetical protein